MARHTSIVIFDTDEFFLEMVERYLLGRNDMEAFFFSREESLKRFFEEREEKVNIVLTCTVKIFDFIKGKTDVQLLLDDYDGQEDGVRVVNKYQKMKNLMEEVLLQYAQESGNVDSLGGNKRTQNITFFSPVGGSGKTTLALVAAQGMAHCGKKVLYINFESIPSTTSLLPAGDNGNLSKVFLAVTSKAGKAALAILTSRVVASGGWDYISGPDSILEINELQPEHIDVFMKEVDLLGEYDAVIYDLSSDLSLINLAILKNADVNILPVLPDGFSMNKMTRMIADRQIKKTFPGILSQSKVVINRCNMMRGRAVKTELQGLGCNVVMELPEEAILSMPERIMAGSPEIYKYTRALSEIILE